MTDNDGGNKIKTENKKGPSKTIERKIKNNLRKNVGLGAIMDTNEDGGREEKNGVQSDDVEMKGDGVSSPKTSGASSKADGSKEKNR